MLVIGSMALQHAGISPRTPADTDFICTIEEYNESVRKFRAAGTLASAVPLSGKKFHIRSKAGANYEYEIAWPGSVAEKLISLVKENGLYEQWEKERHIYASPDVCYTLKLSHRFLKNNPFFNKTMNDIRYLREKGCSVPEPLKDWLKEREDETYDYGVPKLNVKKSEFFTDNVPYKYEHDSIHLAVKTLDKPAYQYFKPEDKEVFCDKELFFAASEDVRLAAVCEESYVLALERCLVPFDFRTPPKQAFLMALEKVCTSITSGWFREYAWENYEEAVRRYDEKYVDRFNEGVNTGLVVPHNGERNVY